MKITHGGGQTTQGPADWFTGTVFLDAIRTPDEQSVVGSAHVRFTRRPGRGGHLAGARHRRRVPRVTRR